MMGEHVSVWQRVCVCICVQVCQRLAQAAHNPQGVHVAPVLKKYIITFQMWWMSPRWSMGDIIQSDKCGTCQNNTTWARERVFFLWWLQCNVQYMCVCVCVCCAYFPVCARVFKQKWASRANLHNSTCASVFMNPSISLCVLIKIFPIAVRMRWYVSLPSVRCIYVHVWFRYMNLSVCLCSGCYLLCPTYVGIRGKAEGVTGERKEHLMLREKQLKSLSEGEDAHLCDGGLGWGVVLNTQKDWAESRRWGK